MVQSLQYISYSQVYRHDVSYKHCLDIYLCPSEIHHKLSIFQHTWRNVWSKKMSALLEVNKLFHKKFREELLCPSNVTFYAPIDAGRILQKGDHIVVFTGDVYHHGIYIGDGYVVHVVSELCSFVIFDSRVKTSNSSALQKTTISEFVGNRNHVGIIYHSYMKEEIDANGEMVQVMIDTNSNDFRNETVTITNDLLQNVSAGGLLFRHYHLLSSNCECFAWAVITRNLNATSEQISKVWKLLMKDIRDHHETFTPAHAIVSSFFIYDLFRRIFTLV